MFICVLVDVFDDATYICGSDDDNVDDDAICVWTYVSVISNHMCKF
jgi:hypothetical protein